LILTKYILSGSREETRALYYRGEATAKDGQLVLKEGQTVSFDTYFNGFFYGAFSEVLQIESISACVVSSGSFQFTLFVLDQNGKQQELISRKVSGEQISAVLCAGKLSDLPPNGMLYVQARALTGGVIYGGTFEISNAPQRTVCVAAVICTYHREDYVQKNLHRIREELMDSGENGVSDALDCLVVDNGRTLPIERDSRVFVFPNVNYGGSGGFTRGIIEAYRRRDRYTHVLLMDDDISFEPEVLARTIRILRLFEKREKPVCIGGQMLTESTPTIQYEAGGNFVASRIQSVAPGLNLSSREGLLANMVPRHRSFNSWWYCCFPLSEVERIGLPYPFFIKCDDIEYGLRMEPQLLLTNGIGVWHQDFSQKVSPYLEYYIKRNELVTSALHDGRNRLRNAMTKLIRAYGKAAIIGDTRNIPFIRKAYRDFLRGPSFFGETDEEELHREILVMNREPARNRVLACLTAPIYVLSDLINLTKSYSRIRESYIRDMKAYATVEFWCDHLKIDPIKKKEEKNRGEKMKQYHM